MTNPMGKTAKVLVRPRPFFAYSSCSGVHASSEVSVVFEKKLLTYESAKEVVIDVPLAVVP